MNKSLLVIFLAMIFLIPLHAEHGITRPDTMNYSNAGVPQDDKQGFIFEEDFNVSLHMDPIQSPLFYSLDSCGGVDAVATYSGIDCPGLDVQIFVNTAGDYSWEGPHGFVSSVQNPIVDNITMIRAGLYKVTVTAADGCVDSAQVLVQVLPTPVLEKDTLLCEHEIVTLQANGGTGPLQYALQNPNFQTSPVFSVLDIGSYPAYVRDSLGCLDSTQIRIVPVPRLRSITPNIVKCDEELGSISVHATGTGMLEYSFDGGSTFTEDSVQSGLLPGFHGVVIRDELLCLDSFEIELRQAPDLNIVSVESTEAMCGDSSGQIIIHPDRNSGVVYTIHEGVIYQLDSIFNGLAAGNYTLVAVDGNNCADTVEFELGTLFDLTLEDIVAQDIRCGGTSGTIEITASSSFEITYSIDGGATFQSEGTFSDVTPGQYEVVISDENGCEVTDSASLVVLEDFEILDVVIVSSDCDIDNGSIHVITDQTDLTYLLSNGDSQKSSFIGNLPSDSFSVFIISPRGCSQRVEAFIPQNDCGLTVSNIFIPNSNGENDRMALILDSSIGGTIAFLEVYDRWGNKVYSATDFSPEDAQYWWDGKVGNQDAQPGVYVYLIEVQLSDQSSFRVSGDVTVFR